MQISLEDRFWAKVDKRGPDECWLWQGQVNGNGYGRFRYSDYRTAAHRVAWQLANGCAPSTFVLHHCDNPPCVNPAHLWQGSQSENMRDMAAKGRSKNQFSKTHCVHGHEYTPENTYRWNGWRFCRACSRIKDARRCEARKEQRRIAA